MNATKQKAGKLGGLATLAKHGKEHMQAIGKRGAAVTWKRYMIVPVDSSGYALVERLTGKVRAIWCTPWIVLPLVVLALSLAGCASWGFAPVTATPYPTPTSSPTATRRPTEITVNVHSDNAPRQSTPTPAACVVAHTNGLPLNVRQSPSLAAPIVAGLMPGQRVTVLSWGDAWLKIPTGYIYSKYCEATK